MKLIQVETPKGVTVLCPYNEKLKGEIIEIRIYYYPRKPSTLLNQCIQPEEIIAQQEGRMTPDGLLFYIEDELRKGFYRIYLSTKPSFYKGERVYPILHGETSLMIGLPYSAYEQLNLN